MTYLASPRLASPRRRRRLASPRVASPCLASPRPAPAGSSNTASSTSEVRCPRLSELPGAQSSAVATCSRLCQDKLACKGFWVGYNGRHAGLCCLTWSFDTQQYSDTPPLWPTMCASPPCGEFFSCATGAPAALRGFWALPAGPACAPMPARIACLLALATRAAGGAQSLAVCIFHGAYP